MHTKGVLNRGFAKRKAMLRFEPLPIFKDKADGGMRDIEYLRRELNDVIKIALGRRIDDPVASDRIAPISC